ncbi:unnamed protein product [Soboliphyme baturini]|uniref:CB1 cannabinoid receptor-interacting protein 1 n=1 Tax=Soboliphyme baturini TaxID=241478 RepID=A0A183IDI4_9BILA|nr:unnamed protein product [Soboliphyme baturini]
MTSTDHHHHRSMNGFEVELCFQCISLQRTDMTFKVDGERFATSSRTLKLYSNANYRVVIRTRPAMDIQKVFLGGDTFNLEHSIEQPGTCSFKWDTTGISESKRRNRHTLQLDIQYSAVSVQHGLQCKFYKLNDPHANWGDKVDWIVLKCSHSEENNATVTEEEFV